MEPIGTQHYIYTGKCC